MNTKEAEKKKKYHEKRVEFYDKKIKEIESKKNVIGFKYPNRKL